MSSFTAPLECRQLSATYWSTTRELTFYSDQFGAREWYTIPANFVTDFASIPRVFWPVIGAPHHFAQAAVLHDYLCRYQVVTRGKADKLFREALSVLGVASWKVMAMYYGVRINALWRQR